MSEHPRPQRGLSKHTVLDSRGLAARLLPSGWQGADGLTLERLSEAKVSSLSDRAWIPDMINISERPAEADDRAVPSHREGDLIIGTNNLSAIGTLVERTTGNAMLVHLPDGYKPEQARDALSAKIQTIPDVLRASLTWAKDQRCATGNSVTRTHHRNGGTSENTNGLLRQYFPKGTDLSIHSAIDLDGVATELNDRPRTRLGFKKPMRSSGRQTPSRTELGKGLGARATGRRAR